MSESDFSNELRENNLRDAGEVMGTMPPSSKWPFLIWSNHALLPIASPSPSGCTLRPIILSLAVLTPTDNPRLAALGMHQLLGLQLLGVLCWGLRLLGSCALVGMGQWALVVQAIGARAQH